MRIISISRNKQTALSLFQYPIITNNVEPSILVISSTLEKITLLSKHQIINCTIRILLLINSTMLRSTPQKIANTALVLTISRLNWAKYKEESKLWSN
jgi:hypothetical protein